MGDILFIIIILNSFIISLLLWFITFLGSFLYKTKQDLNRNVQFECGFFSTNKLTPEYNFNFVISAIFLILYDIEFILLIPYLFNINLFENSLNISALILIIFIIFSLILDIESNTLKWYYN